MEQETIGVESSESVHEEQSENKKNRNDMIVELVLFFILGLLLGFTIKTEAAKRITIGFNDYKLGATKQSYDVPRMQQALLQQASQQSAQQDLPSDEQEGQQQ
jgi:hypothetical protein